VGSQRAVSSRMEAFAKALKQDPQFDGILRERGRQLGIIEDSRLDRVVRARKIDRALTHSIGTSRGAGSMNEPTLQSQRYLNDT
jgi:hypothetical protein